MSTSTRPMPPAVPSIINMGFLRSGGEFNQERVASRTVKHKLDDDDGTATAFVNGPKKDRNTRLAEFYKSMLQLHISADTTAVVSRSKADSSAADINAWDGLSMSNKQPQAINLDFLRSGKQFVQSQKNEAVGGDTEHKNRNSKLDDFYAKTLSAHQHEQSDDGASAATTNPLDDMLDCWDGFGNQSTNSTPSESSAAPTSLVNMDFLRSGGEFQIEPANFPKANSHDRPVMGKNARLEKFHAKTLAPFQH